MNPTEKLAKIKKILCKEHIKTTEDGTQITVTANAYYNLEGALYDIEHRTIDTDIKMGITKPEDVLKIDKICIETIKRVQQQLAEVIRILVEPDESDVKDDISVDSVYRIYKTQGQGDTEIGHADTLEAAIVIANMAMTKGVGVAIKRPDGSWYAWMNTQKHYHDDHWTHPKVEDRSH